MTDQTYDGRKRYKIVFAGDLQSGQDLLSVKTRLSTLLGVPVPIVDKLFIGKPVMIRSNLLLDDAQLFKMQFEKTGVECQLLESSAAPMPARQPYTQISTPAPAPVMTPAPQRGRGTGPRSAPTVTTIYDEPIPRDEGSKLPIFLGIGGGLFILFIALFYYFFLKPPDAPPPPTYMERKMQEAFDAQMEAEKRANERVAEAQRQQRMLENGNRTPAPSGSSPSTSTSSSTSAPPVIKKPKFPTTLYKGPKGYYKVALPKGFSIRNQSKGNRSKVTAIYPDGSNVTIIAYQSRNTNRIRDPYAEMTEEVQAIQEANTGKPTDYLIKQFGLVSFSGMDGYEIALSKDKQIAHTYSLKSPDNKIFSIAVIAVGPDAEAQYEKLNWSIRDSFRPFSPL